MLLLPVGIPEILEKRNMLMLPSNSRQQARLSVTRHLVGTTIT